MEYFSITTLLASVFFGALGGSARVCLGILKTKSRINPRKALSNLLLSCTIGVFCALLFSNSYKLSLLAGYAGIDIAEGILKILRKRIGTRFPGEFKI
ncbi:MAG: hypothetical protein V1659_04530 [Candidatus Woesearchaeota archaeon]